MKVSNFNQLLSAVKENANEIIIEKSFLCPYSVILPEGSTLKGKMYENGEFPLLSFDNNDGIGLSANNTIADLNIHAAVNKKAVFSAFTQSNLGDFLFKNLLISGQFSFITKDEFENADITIEGIDIIASDSRNYLEQPQKYGVNVLQGALTIYNLSSSEKSKITLTAKNISIGRKNAPVSGSGIFIAGFGDEGGKTIIEMLQTNAVYSHGKIPSGVADFITAAIFIANGTDANEIVHNGEIITYGVNDMVLDTWGKVKNWTCNAPVISYGPSGVGFVNFGIVENFTANAPLETYGLGARGYNQYDGTIENVTFDSVSTFGDGAVAIQISKKIGKLTVHKNAATHGGVGNSLVKGKNILLPAISLSIKEGGEVDQIKIGGNLQTFGDNVFTYSVDGGIVKQIEIGGEVIASGENSAAINVSNGGKTPII
ncbi:hypothetical protein SAMN05421594_2627 [Chryseobacterium oleae]|uniref:Uncharacterized protein n=1 Tax=Chryseobacterium oleae TaxID=491207 RepID=A0A1I4YSF7_CHROL|nr:hypothetical protein [Chryseobacterium oleae]SFN40589.1 hypothetical protein SAMN05421594_2627 [Chryseobacterium oleae]